LPYFIVISWALTHDRHMMPTGCLPECGHAHAARKAYLGESGLMHIGNFGNTL
jgi:hypothetical protein